MRKRKKFLLPVLLLVFILVGCSSEDVKIEETPPTQVEEENKGVTDSGDKNEMIIAMNAPTTLNPIYNTSANIQQALYLIFSPLINIEENGTISGHLAESWMVNETNTAVTVTLRNDIKWHDGVPFTSEDVLFTLSQIQSASNSPYKVATDNIASMEKIDDLTFKIIYKQPFSGVLQTLFFPVIPKHIYNVADNNQLGIKPVGTGPYVFENMAHLKQIDLVANKDYFKGMPHINEVKINIIPDEESSLYAFKQGLIDVVYTQMTDWGKYASNKRTTAYEMTSNIYEFMGLNLNKTIYQNTNIRLALLYALDRQDLVHRYYLDHAVVTDTPISPKSYLYDKTLEIKNYDKEKTRLLLMQEGYEKSETSGLMTKNGVPFTMSLLVNSENNDRLKIAEEIKKMYREVGIELTIEAVPEETYLERIKSKQFDAFLGGWQLAYATDLSFAFHSNSIVNGGNYVGYRDSTMDELLGQAFIATEDNMLESYSKLQQYFVQQTPSISLYFKKSVLITSSKIKGNVKPTPLNIYANVEEWTK